MRRSTTAPRRGSHAAFALAGVDDLVEEIWAALFSSGGTK
jgi:hypothetical protein